MDVNWPELLAGLVLSVAVGEIVKTLPKTSEHIVKFAARRLTDKRMAQIREEEWLSSLEEQPSDVGKFLHACENLIASLCIENNSFSLLEKVGYLTVHLGTIAWSIYATFNPMPMGADIKSLPLWFATLGFVFSMTVIASRKEAGELPLSAKRFRALVYALTFISYSQAMDGMLAHVMYAPAALWLVLWVVSFDKQGRSSPLS